MRGADNKSKSLKEEWNIKIRSWKKVTEKRMSKKQLEEKHLKMLRQMLTLTDNKKCMDCKEKGPFYACTTFGTFVCPTCSGLHREFGHRVKSISMATFTPEEVKFLQEMGNGNARDIWLANWSPSDYPEPDAGDKEKIKDFMQKKYVQKVWYRKPGSEEPARARTRERNKARNEAPVRAEPLEAILGKDIPPIQITHNVNVNVSGMQQRKEKSTKELLWEEPVPAIPPHQPSFHTIAPPTPLAHTAPAPAPVPAAPSSGLSGLESLFTMPIQEPPKPVQTPTWPQPAPSVHQSAPLAGPLPHITTEMFQQMNPQQQQHYLAMQQQWLQQQQLILQQRMSAVPISQPTVYPSSLNPFAPQMPQMPQVYAPVPQPFTSPVMGQNMAMHTSAPLLPTAQPKEVKKPDNSSLLFADLSPLGAKTTTPAPSGPTLMSASRSAPSPFDFGAMQGPSSGGAPPAQTNSYNPFGF